MGGPATVPMFSPDGSTTGDIPADQVTAAQQAGFKRALSMVSPDGKSTGYIPEDRVNDAAKAGFRFGVADNQQPSDLDLYKQALFNPKGSGAAGGIGGDILQAGGRAMQAITAPILHPIDTATGVYNAIRHPIDTATQRVNEFKQEWQQDPGLALANATGDVAGTVEGGRLGSAALQKGASLAAPLASRVLLLGKTPEAAYESALKPSTTISQADRAAIVQTGLQNKIPISKSGLETLGDQIDMLNQAIKDEIAKDPNRTIDPNLVAQRTGPTANRFANQVTPNSDLAAIEATRQEFLANQGARPAIPPKPNGLFDAQGRPIMNQGTPAQPAQPMAAADAQAMKQGTYQVLKGKYGEQGSASVEGQKALARGLKEEIATQFPEINDLNAQESKLLDLQPVLERAVNRISNHQLIGIGTPIAGAAAKAVTGSGTVGAVAGVLKAVLDNPVVKSRLAISLSKGGNIPFGQAAARVAAYSTALGAAASPNQSTPPQP